MGGASPGRPGRSRSPDVADLDEPVSGPKVDVRMALEDVMRRSHRRYEPSRCYVPGVHDPERIVEPEDEDREPHPEGVH